MKTMVKMKAGPVTSGSLRPHTELWFRLAAELKEEKSEILGLVL